MPNITSVTVSFGNGQKREEYGPVKKADASITAAVAEGEDGTVVLEYISAMVLNQVAALLDAPKPTVEAYIATVSQEEKPAVGEAPARRRGRPPKAEAAPEPTQEPSPEPASENESKPEPASEPAEDDWSSSAADIEITDQQILSATSKRAGELGAREPIVKLIATFATRTEGAPFKVQEIPQAQRKDYLEKLTALTA